MQKSSMLSLISIVILFMFIAGCGEEQAGEAGKFLKPGARGSSGSGGSDREGLQAAGGVSPGGQDVGVAGSGSGQGSVQVGTTGQDMVVGGQETESLEGAQAVASHTVDSLRVSDNRFGNVKWQWVWPGDCVFAGQPGFRLADVYIDGGLKDTLDCKSDPAQYTEKFSAGESHTIKVVTVRIDSAGTETRNSPGVSNTVVVA